MWFYYTRVRPKDAVQVENSVDPDQMAPQSDLGLNRLHSSVCPKTYTVKNPKISDSRKFAVITLKVEQDGFSLE